jgi:hypothetical protein
MIVRRTVGVAPGTTTLALRGTMAEDCLPTIQPMNFGPGPGGAPTAAQAEAAAGAPTVGPMNPYANEIELNGRALRGLGLIPVPYGVIPGQPASEVVASYMDADNRMGCDPQHYENGEEGYYYDSPLGSAIPTDAELSKNWNHLPLNSGWVTDVNGRMWPVPWMPPNGWNVDAGASGAQPTPPLPGLGAVTAVQSSTHLDSRTFWLSVISATSAVVIAGVAVWGAMRSEK